MLFLDIIPAIPMHPPYPTCLVSYVFYTPLCTWLCILIFSQFSMHLHLSRHHGTCFEAKKVSIRFLMLRWTTCLLKRSKFPHEILAIIVDPLWHYKQQNLKASNEMDKEDVASRWYVQTKVTSSSIYSICGHDVIIMGAIRWSKEGIWGKMMEHWSLLV